ncbi:hypothetical protein ASPWEDRAFT_43672 [Aspergillus wentii DTO 134E9]|uniref:DUF1868 domain-containing protein n=1 Tax=Aspergillus wentii DTO 134E9 TaxID=1073089 RepID=A0A1L9R789_ASPWE|nr:uncharacterized protein ASPWEDRAFT_44748 [Aspergillus wentii DTO 134E9]XP_040685394.1 uncharacterized protein ASPWEDRAFT_43672 [Aspergillus wentii DTO 134E9]OJJ30764.1 hypothetical protein ASPWEDRAFT_44748 [Aspergillus wentii DTO 134E9]OJJ31717.1 hypothetical protein ASPWEDRAFT_43672 [Aspergillus wentii DTO 134E9]
MTENTVQNPFQQFIIAHGDDKDKIQERYETHRTTRAADFKSKILNPNFQGWQVDEILKKLHVQAKNADGSPFVDSRNNLAFYARPPQHIRELAGEVQQEIRSIAPSMWFTPSAGLHMTTLELANSRSPEEIDEIVSRLSQTGALPDIVNYTLHHRARLIKPVVSYDASAIALSFVPATDEEGDDYTYHHLRRDLFDEVTAAGIPIHPRYTVPSSHIALARFITHDGFLLDKPNPDGSSFDRERVNELIQRIEEINQNLKEKYWPKQDGSSKGDWVVGHEKGFEFCKGTSWYGGGECVLVGEGFQ